MAHTAHLDSRTRLALLVGLLLASYASPTWAVPLYSIDITSDLLVSVETDTGAVTEIGPLNFDATNAQLTLSGGVLYLAIPTAGIPELYSVNQASGAATFLANIAVPTVGGVGAPQLGEGLTADGTGLLFSYKNQAVGSGGGAVSNAIGDLSLAGALTNTTNYATNVDNDVIAYDDGTGQLYAVDFVGSSSIYYEVDHPASASRVSIGSGPATMTLTFAGGAAYGLTSASLIRFTSLPGTSTAIAWQAGYDLRGLAGPVLPPGPSGSSKTDFDTGTIAPFQAFEFAPTARIPQFGGTLRIEVPIGIGTASTLDPTVLFSDVLGIVDILDWTAGIDQSVALTTILDTGVVGAPSNQGYLLGMNFDDGTIRLIKLENNLPVDDAISAPVTLNPDATDYRLVFRRDGTELEGELYDLKALPTPIATVSLSDPLGIPGFAGGLPGLFVSESQVTPAGADVTIDNLVFVTYPPGSDAEADDFQDADDNCQIVSNGVTELSLQVDSDRDGFGNACDADFDNNDITSLADATPLNANWGTLVDGADLQLDLDGDRAVTLGDFAEFYKALLSGAPPGP